MQATLDDLLKLGLNDMLLLLNIDNTYKLFEIDENRVMTEIISSGLDINRRDTLGYINLGESYFDWKGSLTFYGFKSNFVKGEGLKKLYEKQQGKEGQEDFTKGVEYWVKSYYQALADLYDTGNGVLPVVKYETKEEIKDDKRMKILKELPVINLRIKNSILRAKLSDHIYARIKKNDPKLSEEDVEFLDRTADREKFQELMREFQKQ